MTETTSSNLEVFQSSVVIDQIDLPSDKPTLSIVSVDSFENSIYLGTNESMILLYRIEEIKKSSYIENSSIYIQPPVHHLTQNRLYHTHLLHKNIFDIQMPTTRKGATVKGNVTQIKVVSQINRAFLLLEGHFIVVHSQSLETMELGTKTIKNVLCFCINEKPQHAYFEVCLGFKGRLSVYQFMLHPDRLQATREIPVQNEIPHSVAIDGSVIIATLRAPDSKLGRYSLIQMETKSANFQELCPITKEIQFPFVSRALQGNFFFNVGICQFSNTKGTANHPPVEWDSDVKNAVFVFPYIVSASANKVCVYSFLTQKKKQEFLWKDIRSICLSAKGEDARVLAIFDRSVYILKSTGLQHQTQILLRKNCIDEALQLSRVEHAFLKSRSTLAIADSYLIKIKQQIGILYLQAYDFQPALTQLIEGQIDPREIIHLLPGLALDHSNYTPKFSETEVARKIFEDEQQIRHIIEFKEFLVSYLKAKNESSSLHLKEHIDTAILNILAQLKSNELISFIYERSVTINFEKGVEILTENNSYYALGMFYSYNHQIEIALHTWIKICEGKTRDPIFPGFNFIVEYLTNLGYPKLVLKFGEWALEADENIAVSIFTKRPKDETSNESLSQNSILTLLEKFPYAKSEYMRHLVHDPRVDDSKLHTAYAQLLLQELIKDSKSRKPKMDIREKNLKAFREFLNYSKFYDPVPLHAELAETEFFNECAIVLGRMGKHQEALEIYAYKLKNHQSAFEYCVNHSKGKSRVHRQDLYVTLLRVYMQAKSKKETPLFNEAQSLLSNPMVDISSYHVLDMIPADWSLAELGPFLKRSIMSNNHSQRTTAIEHNLAKWERVQVKYELSREEQKKVILSDNSECQLCGQNLGDSAFVRYPNGVIIHMKCMKNKHYCPLTGKYFGGNS